MATATVKAAKSGKLVGGDREEFAAFYRRCGGEVLRALALSLGDQELARDATQEAMARAWRGWDKVQAYTNPAGWVYRVGLNWGRSRLRRFSREVLGRLHDQPAVSPIPADPDLARALMTLPHRHRVVLVLRLYLDWPVEAVAAVLGIPEGTVRSRQHNALKSLRKALEVDP